MHNVKHGVVRRCRSLQKHQMESVLHIQIYTLGHFSNAPSSCSQEGREQAQQQAKHQYIHLERGRLSIMTESMQTAALCPPAMPTPQLAGFTCQVTARMGEAEIVEASGQQIKERGGNHENKVPSLDCASQIPNFEKFVSRIRSYILSTKSQPQVFLPSKWIPVAPFVPEPNRTLCYLVFLQPCDQRNFLVKTAQTALPFLQQSWDLLYPLPPLAIP